MITKKKIVEDWLPRYTGLKLKEFGQYILLVNFTNYVQMFADKFGVPVHGQGLPMQSASADGITIVNFGIGSPMAATAMDLLSAVEPKAVLFLGKCGGLKKKTEVGDLILPIAAIRSEGTSDQYLPPEIPALPSFALQRSISSTIIKHQKDYWTGTIYTTNRRVWEHDDDFKNKLLKSRAMGIDMETATIFVTGFVNQIPRGALLLVSDNPLDPEGVKTKKSDEKVTREFVTTHLEIGIDSLKELASSGESVKHLRFEE
ncbi:MAG: AMP nucleosidase [Candidatus Dadabacteria bacterium]|nr:MAG: AMP nucleosidase [Candidatus Dadabacteria bacterium]